MLLKHNMLAKIFTSFLLYHSFTFPFYCQLQSVQVDSKLNGIIVKLELDSLPDYKNISGWQSDNDWFYLTLYQCKTPLNGSILKSVHEDILKFEIIENEESLQLGIKSKEPIDQFNFSTPFNKNTIIASLHFSTKILATENKNKTINHHFDDVGISMGIKTWLNTTGVGLTISGLVREDKMTENFHFKAGLSIIITTFILDKILRNF